MTLSPQFLDELRARTTLSTLVGKTVKLQKAGREFKAPCPLLAGASLSCDNGTPVVDSRNRAGVECASGYLLSAE
jgi:hypothetical protein